MGGPSGPMLSFQFATYDRRASELKPLPQTPRHLLCLRLS
ncbi:DUF6053 domain-containing protein [Lysobacter enzymogenes]